MQDRQARNSGRAFETIYTAADIRLLAEVGEEFGAMSGLATCEFLRRAFATSRAAGGCRSSTTSATTRTSSCG